MSDIGSVIFGLIVAVMFVLALISGIDYFVDDDKDD